MSGDMQSWRPFISSTASKLNSFKGYLTSRDPRPLSPAPSYEGGGDPSNPRADLGSATGPTRQSWKQWANEKLRGNQSQEDNTNFVETISLFPGWAARRLGPPSLGESTRIPSMCWVHAIFLIFCYRNWFQRGCLCSRVRSKGQQARVHVTVSAGIPEVGKGYVLLLSHVNVNPTHSLTSL